VIPHFKGRLAAPKASHDWAVGKREQIFGRAGQAVVNAIKSHAAEQAAPQQQGQA
jgi:limonene 1,2-monooxygenase